MAVSRSERGLRTALRLLAGVSATVLMMSGAPALSADAQGIQVAAVAEVPDTSTLDKSLEFVDRAIAQGDYEKAAGLLSGILLSDPDNPKIKLILGDLYTRMGSYDQARIYLNQALASNRLSVDEQKDANILLALVDGDVPRRDRAGFVLTGQFSTGIRYRSNANSGTDNDTFTIQDAEVAARSDTDEESDFDWYGIASLRGTYGLSDKVALDVRGLGLYRKQFDISRNDLLVLQARPGLFIEAFQSGGTNITARPYAIVGLAKLDNELAYITTGLGARLQERVTDKIGFDQTVELEKVEYRPISGREGLDNLDGSRARVELGANYTFNDMLIGRVSYRFRHRDAERNFDDRDQHRLRAEIMRFYPTPFNWTDEMSAIQVAVSYEDSDYEAADPTISATRVREDSEWVFEIANTIAIHDGLNADVDFTHRNRNSEFSNYERDDTTIAVGVTYKF